MPSLTDLLLLVLASFRLTHLVAFDKIAAPLRTRAEPSPLLHELLTCYWCCGVWVSALLGFSFLQWPAIAKPAILILAVAGGQSVVENLLQRK